MSNQDEYIIVNKAQILEKIEELKKWSDKPIVRQQDEIEVREYSIELITLKDVLSQSTPLISEIEKAYEAGKLDKELSMSFDNPKGRYFSSLKLDI